MCWLVCRNSFTIQQNQKKYLCGWIQFHLKCRVYIFYNKQIDLEEIGMLFFFAFQGPEQKGVSQLHNLWIEKVS